jgi:hypothetical protein
MPASLAAAHMRMRQDGHDRASYYILAPPQSTIREGRSSDVALRRSERQQITEDGTGTVVE